MKGAIIMKKKVILRCLLGAPIGVSISFIAAIAISAVVGDGKFYPAAPELIRNFDSELSAVIFQSVISILYGAVWGGASVIWETESWSLLKQTVTHLILCSLATLPVAYCTHWMEHSASGIIKYFIIFFGVYFFVWISQYIPIKIRLQRINEKLKTK